MRKLSPPIFAKRNGTSKPVPYEVEVIKTHKKPSPMLGEGGPPAVDEVRAGLGFGIPDAPKGIL